MKNFLGVLSYVAVLGSCTAIATQVETNEEEQFAKSEASLIKKFESYASKAEIKSTVEEVDFKLPTYSKTKWRYDQFLENIKGCFDKVSGLEDFRLSISNAFAKADYYNFNANVKKDITLSLEKLYQKYQYIKASAKKEEIVETIEAVTPRNSFDGNDLSNESKDLEEVIYDEDGLFIDDNLKAAQKSIDRINDYAYRHISKLETAKYAIGHLQDYYQDVQEATREFRDCFAMLVSEIDKCSVQDGEEIKNISVYKELQKLTK